MPTNRLEPEASQDEDEVEVIYIEDFEEIRAIEIAIVTLALPGPR